MSQRERPWTDDQPVGRIVLLSANPVATALETIATTAGRSVEVIAADDDGAGVRRLGELGLTDLDAVVLCDHDAPDAPRVLRDALASPAPYVAMLASRRRACALLDELEGEGVPGLEKLHMPAGHNLGGKAPGEIALSIVAEIVAEQYGRPGGPMAAGPVLPG